jgi:predicted nuclease of restriction endonuclease-like (RecB) superfamily
MLESVKNNWSTRELERQINSLLYKRLALSKDSKKVLELSTKGQVIQKPKDVIKDPYVLEFLDGDNPTIGLILCSDKNEAMVRYTLLEER